MHAIYLVTTPDDGTTRPVVLLTREAVVPYLQRVTVAAITSTIRGLRTEVVVDRANGVDHESAVSCDNIQTITKARLGEPIGRLTIDQEARLSEAIRTAFDLL